MPGEKPVCASCVPEIEAMSLKKLLPRPFRDALRPTWQRLRRDWQESAWSPTPSAWKRGRERVLRESSAETLLELAGSEFGITQVRSEITGLIGRPRELAPKTIVEVGTHKGGNSFLFCHAVPSAQRVVGVDLCVQNGAKLVHFVRPGQRYFPLHGDSQTAAMKARVQSRLGGSTVDFLFIDGDHSYKGVKADYELYSPLVRSGGIIALHDIVPDHRTRFGRETGCYAGEVHQFWAELKRTHAVEELIDDAEQDGFGIGLIRVR